MTPNATQINAYTGNAERIVEDLYTPSVSSVGLTWLRYDDTRVATGTQQLGVGGSWRYSFQWDLSYIPSVNGSTPYIYVVYPDGTYNYFTNTSPNVWTSTSAVTDYIVQNGSTFVLTNSSDTSYTFQPSGGIGGTGFALTAITDMRGQVTTFTYTMDVGTNTTVMHTITEPGGRYLVLTWGDYLVNRIQTSYTGGGHSNAMPQNGGTTVYGYVPYITSVATSDGRTVTYTYTQTYGNQIVDKEPGETITTTPYYNALTTAAYSGSPSTQGTYTYTTPQPYELTQANDVRELGGIPDVKYTYFSGTNVGLGVVQTAVEATSGTTVTTVSLPTNNPQAPQVTYPDGSLYSYSVNAGGLLSGVENTLSNANNFAYSAGTGTWTTSGTDANGNTSSVTRTTNGELLTRTWPKVGSETTAPFEQWTYNSLGSMISYTDTLGHTTTFTRDPNTDLVTSISYPDGTSESFTYNSFAEPLTHVRRNGGTEYFTYDSTGLLQQEQDAMGNVTKFTYDSNYRVSNIQDARLNSTAFQYDDFGRTLKITHVADGTYQSFTYDTIGDLLTKTDELGHTTTYTYDGYRRVLTAKDALLRTTTYAYDPKAPTNSAPTLVTLPSGKQVSTSYQANWGYQASQVITAYGTANAETTKYGYDADGNVNSVTDPLGHATTFGYDARNRKSWAKDPAGNEAMFYYDDASNLTSQITPDGTSVMTYDTMNRLKTMNDARNEATSYTYDSEGKLKTYTDPKTNVYTYSYDYDERPTSTLYPDGTSQSVTYDPASNTATMQTRDGRLETLSYDNRNRNTGYTWNDGVTPSVTTAYDSASRITSITNANSALSYAYDSANEVSSETQNVTGLGSKTVSYTYTPDSILYTLTYPDSTALTYAYDNVNNLTSIKQGSATVVSYAYDANNNRTGKNLANGVTSTLTYDNVERLTSITDLTPVPTSGTLLQKFQYGYDAMSRRTYVKRNNGVGDVYGYDTADQLTSVQYNCTNPDTTPTNPSQTVAYTYDNAGNRTQVLDSVNGTTAYTPNADNQYTTVGANTASYDGRGNLTALGGTTYSYDASNRLTSYSDSFANSVTQAYDPLGRCVKRTINGVTTFFVYDLGWRLLNEYNSSGGQVYRYVNGPAANEIVSRTDSSSNVIYYHTDGLGSITKLTSSTGALIEQYSYDAFGQTTIQNASGTTIASSAYGNRFMYTGAELVAPMNLYNNRNRFYSPSLGRFLQPDPIGHAGDGYNIYRYCGNSPVNATDPAGEDPATGTVIIKIGNNGDVTSGEVISAPSTGWGTGCPQVGYLSDGQISNINSTAGTGSLSGLAGDTVSFDGSTVSIQGLDTSALDSNAPSTSSTQSGETSWTAVTGLPDSVRTGAIGFFGITLVGALTFATGGLFADVAAGTTTIISAGGSTGYMTVSGGVATVDVGMVYTPITGFANAINAAAIDAGADTIVVNTGPVIDSNLAISLGLRAQSGATFLGGTVALGEPLELEGATYQTFTITGPVW